MHFLQGILIRDGHADIFADAHRCGYPHYPTYVGYSAIYAAHISDRHPIRFRMAIPNMYMKAELSPHLHLIGTVSIRIPVSSV